jgi:Predicted flavin-nucleotide-binding protein structurally related to pyridoxine 5''-phosphate oxidase
MKIPEEVREIFENKKPHQLATTSKEGIPNTSFIGATYLRDGETIVIVDNYMNKTCCNILSNPNVAILIRNDRLAYQLKGNADIVQKVPNMKKQDDG